MGGGGGLTSAWLWVKDKSKRKLNISIQISLIEMLSQYSNGPKDARRKVTGVHLSAASSGDGRQEIQIYGYFLLRFCIR